MNVFSMRILLRICEVLQCNIGDIMDVVPDENEENAKKL
jgi:DNA-binding Xre family transcriptional regulator